MLVKSALWHLLFSSACFSPASTFLLAPTFLQHLLFSSACSSPSPAPLLLQPFPPPAPLHLQPLSFSSPSQSSAPLLLRSLSFSSPSNAMKDISSQSLPCSAFTDRYRFRAARRELALVRGATKCNSPRAGSSHEFCLQKRILKVPI